MGQKEDRIAIRVDQEFALRRGALMPEHHIENQNEMEEVR